MSNYSEALAFAASFCSMSEHCTSEVAEKMKRFDLSKDEKTSILNRLENEGFLNDHRYVNSYIKDKVRFAKWGRVKIRYTLRQKGISNDLIEEGLNEIVDGDYDELLMDLLRQKRKSTKANSTYELRGKLIRFATAKGFELDLAVRCLQKLGLEYEED